MATRFYFIHDSTPPFTLPLTYNAGGSQWNYAALDYQRLMSPSKTGSTVGGIAGVTASPSIDSLNRMAVFISPPLAAQYISSGNAATCKMSFSCSQYRSTDDCYLAAYLTLCDNAGTKRLSFFENVNWNEFPLNTLPSSRILGNTIWGIQANDGDRLVLEVGFYAATPSYAGDPVTIGIIDAPAYSDLAYTDGDTATACPWLEISQDLIFLDEAASASNFMAFF